MADRSRLNTLAIGDWFLFLTQDLHKKELKIKVIRSVEHLFSVALRTSDWGARRLTSESRTTNQCSLQLCDTECPCTAHINTDFTLQARGEATLRSTTIIPSPPALPEPVYLFAARSRDDVNEPYDL